MPRHGSSGATTALTQIYSPPSHPMPSTSEGIVVQALSLVSDNPAGHFSPGAEPNLKKISKRRKKANGEVDVEHTKSNNEFLRKIQQSLRDSQGYSSSDEERPESSSDSSCANWNSRRDEDSSSSTAKTTASTSFSDTSIPRSSTLRTSETQTPSNPYGYEDPDKVVGQVQVRRIPRIARRRGSVTEHTIRAAQKAAAFAAAERAQTMQLSRKMDAVSMAAAAAQRLQNLPGTSQRTLQQFQSRLQRSRMSMNGSSSPATRINPPEINLSSAPKSNPYGYEDMDMPTRDANKDNEAEPNPDARASQPAPSQNRYGYEDPDALNSNPYGYGDAMPQAGPRMRHRPRRRGSVTQYSLGAAMSVAAASEDANEDAPATNEYKPVVPPCVQQDRNLTPKQGLRQPTRKLSPWQTENPALLACKSALSRTPLPPGAPTVFKAPPSRSSSVSESFRTNRSNDIPASSDEEDSIVSSSSEESSLDDSFASITIPLKDESSKRDGPARPPSRHDSMRSHASRDSTNHSVRTYDSDDGDSLAPDMKSLCSISQHDRFINAGNGAASASSSGPPTLLPQTPPPRSLSRKLLSPHISARNGHPKKQGQAVERQSSGSLIPMTMTIVDTSPLPSPKTSKRGFYSRTSSFQGEMMYQPDLPDEAKSDH